VVLGAPGGLSRGSSQTVVAGDRGGGTFGLAEGVAARRLGLKPQAVQSPPLRGDPPPFAQARRYFLPNEAC
jgi:hypothetical protein